MDFNDDILSSYGISLENREFLKRLKILNIDTKYEVIKSISRDIYEVVDKKIPDKRLMLKLLNLSNNTPYRLNLTLNAFRETFKLLGDAYLQDFISEEEKYNEKKDICRYSDFLCYKDLFVSAYNKKLVFISVYEKVIGETLGELEQTFIEDDEDFPLELLINIGYSLLVSLYILHSNGVYHRDIKPDNIIYNKEEEWPSRVKLIDFDFSCSAREKCIGNPGTKTYASKYVLSYEQIPNEVWGKADIVSLSITLFKLFTTDDSEKSYFEEKIPSDEDLLVEWIESKCLNRELDEDGLAFSFFLVNLFDYDTNKEKYHISLSDIIKKYEELFEEYIDNSLIRKFNEI